MKKRKLIPFALISASLALGVTAAFAASKNAVPVHAEDVPGVLAMYLGTHDLLADPHCDSSDVPAFEGSADLEDIGGEYVLTLNNFNNHGVYKDVPTTGSDKTCAVLRYINPETSPKPLRIRVNGESSLSIPSSINGQGYDYCKTVYVATKEANGVDVYVEGVNGTSPVLNVESPELEGESCAFSCASVYSSGSVTVSDVYIGNCEVNVSGGKGLNSYGIELIGCALHVGSGANITATAAGNNSDDSDIHEAVAISTDSYEQTGGKVVATTGSTINRGESYGLKIKKADSSITNGELEARAGDTARRTTSGIWLTQSKFSINAGAVVTAVGGSIGSAESGSTTTGIKRNNFDGSCVTVHEDASYVYAAGMNAGGGLSMSFFYYFDAGYDFWGSTKNDIFTDPDVYSVSAGNGKYNAPKQALFVKEIQCEAKSTSVAYDGNPHEAITITDVKPANYTAKYKLEGETEWSTAVPQFTNANEAGYVVNYKIESNFCSTAKEGSVTFTITKGASAVGTAPTLVTDFVSDGQEHALVNAGTATGGTMVYSVNGGAYSETVPTAKDAGEYEVSYKIIGDANHNDTAPVSLGKVVVSAPAPTPDPGSGSGLSVGAIVGIVIGSFFFALIVAFVLLMFVFNKWIKEGDKAVRVLRFALGSKDGKQRYFSLKFKFVYRNKEEVFNTKNEALK